MSEIESRRQELQVVNQVAEILNAFSAINSRLKSVYDSELMIYGAACHFLQQMHGKLIHNFKSLSHIFVIN